MAASAVSRMCSAFACAVSLALVAACSTWALAWLRFAAARSSACLARSDSLASLSEALIRFSDVVIGPPSVVGAVLRAAGARSPPPSGHQIDPTIARRSEDRIIPFG